MTVLSALRRGAGFTPWRSGTASLGRGCRVFGHPTGVVECSAQDHLDLAVEAAELVVGPAGERVVDGRVDPEQDLSAIAHV
jgi:hypothetical protein